MEKAVNWKPIERVTEPAIWVLKYYMYSKDGNFVPPETEGALKLASCHGWYESEADALAVLRHFPKPNGYHIEKVWKRELFPSPTPN